MSLEDRVRFVRTRTTVEPVPLVPELAIHQATSVTPLWHATAAELEDSDPAPFWAFPWAGGQALARYVLDHPGLVRDRVVLDFATGSGLVALAAARAGAAHVEACDIDPFCEAAVELNARVNGVAIRFRGQSALHAALPGFDVVLAGDVFYEKPLAHEAMSWLARLASEGMVALVGDPGRTYSPSTGVTTIATYDVPTSADIESAPSLRTSVLGFGAAPFATLR